jgi:hypothetical protein
VTFDSSTGNLYVSDTYNYRIVRYTPNATVGTVVAGGNGGGVGTNQLNLPRGLIYDVTTNSLIIANSNANNIVRWVIGTTSWTLLVGSGSGSSGQTAERLQSPKDVIQVFSSFAPIKSTVAQSPG